MWKLFMSLGIQRLPGTSNLRAGMGFYLLVSHNDMLALISFFSSFDFIGHNCQSSYTVYQRAL